MAYKRKTPAKRPATQEAPQPTITESPALARQVGGVHYKQYPIQPVEYAFRNKLQFCEGCIVKYVTRHRDKGGRADLEKALHFLQMLIEFEYPD